MQKIGVTELLDPAFDHSWVKWALTDRKPIILITKNVKKLLEDFPGIELQKNVLIHVTITGYGGSFLEPGVEKPQELLNFLEQRNKERIVCRIDPIIPIDDFVNRSKQVYILAKSFGFTRFRISILDLYSHVMKLFNPYLEFQQELKRIYNWDLSHSLGEHQEYMIHAPYVLRKKIIDFFPGSEICGEPGFQCEGCISKKDLELFGIKPEEGYPECEQRPHCNCLGIKHNFPRNTKESCPNGCLYCYLIQN
jgi:DNA repair photolyase